MLRSSLVCVCAIFSILILGLLGIHFWVNYLKNENVISREVISNNKIGFMHETQKFASNTRKRKARIPNDNKELSIEGPKEIHLNNKTNPRTRLEQNDTSAQPKRKLNSDVSNKSYLRSHLAETNLTYETNSKNEEIENSSVSDPSGYIDNRYGRTVKNTRPNYSNFSDSYHSPSIKKSRIYDETLDNSSNISANKKFRAPLKAKFYSPTLFYTFHSDSHESFDKLFRFSLLKTEKSCIDVQYNAYTDFTATILTGIDLENNITKKKEASYNHDDNQIGVGCILDSVYVCKSDMNISRYIDKSINGKSIDYDSTDFLMKLLKCCSKNLETCTDFPPKATKYPALLESDQLLHQNTRSKIADKYYPLEKYARSWGTLLTVGKPKCRHIEFLIEKTRSSTAFDRMKIVQKILVEHKHFILQQRNAFLAAQSQSEPLKNPFSFVKDFFIGSPPLQSRSHKPSLKVILRKLDEMHDKLENVGIALIILSELVYYNTGFSCKELSVFQIYNGKFCLFSDSIIHLTTRLTHAFLQPFIDQTEAITFHEEIIRPKSIHRDHGCFSDIRIFCSYRLPFSFKFDDFYRFFNASTICQIVEESKNGTFGPETELKRKALMELALIENLVRYKESKRNENMPISDEPYRMLKFYKYASSKHYANVDLMLTLFYEIKHDGGVESFDLKHFLIQENEKYDASRIL